MNVKLDVKASPELLKNLKTINDRIMVQVKKAMVETALVDVESEAKKKLTAGGHIVTGRLRSSIHTEYAGENTNFSYKAKEFVVSKRKVKGKIKRVMKSAEFTGKLNVTPKETDTYFDVYVGTNVSYAQKIERLDPYLYPSFLSSKNKLYSRIKRILKKT